MNTEPTISWPPSLSESKIEEGLEWFVLKKRSQRARKARLKHSKKGTKGAIESGL